MNVLETSNPSQVRKELAHHTEHIFPKLTEVIAKFKPLTTKIVGINADEHYQSLVTPRNQKRFVSSSWLLDDSDLPLYQEGFGNLAHVIQDFLSSDSLLGSDTVLQMEPSDIEFNDFYELFPEIPKDTLQRVFTVLKYGVDPEIISINFQRMAKQGKVSQSLADSFQELFPLQEKWIQYITDYSCYRELVLKNSANTYDVDVKRTLDELVEYWVTILPNDGNDYKDLIMSLFEHPDNSDKGLSATAFLVSRGLVEKLFTTGGYTDLIRHPESFHDSPWRSIQKMAQCVEKGKYIGYLVHTAQRIREKYFPDIPDPIVRYWDYEESNDYNAEWFDEDHTVKLITTIPDQSALALVHDTYELNKIHGKRTVIDIITAAHEIIGHGGFFSLVPKDEIDTEISAGNENINEFVYLCGEGFSILIERLTAFIIIQNPALLQLDINDVKNTAVKEIRRRRVNLAKNMKLIKVKLSEEFKDKVYIDSERELIQPHYPIGFLSIIWPLFKEHVKNGNRIDYHNGVKAVVDFLKSLPEQLKNHTLAQSKIVQYYLSLCKLRKEEMEKLLLELDKKESRGGILGGLL